MAQFLLMLYEDPKEFADLSPDQMQAVIEEYTAWRRRLEERGRYVASQKLADEGGRRVSLVEGEVRVVDGPYAEAKEVIGGFFLIEAADYDEAIAVSRDCPHLEYGERIDIRQVDVV